MQHFAHVIDGIVVERADVPDGLTPGVDLFTAAFARDLIPCEGHVSTGDLYDHEKQAFTPAPPPPAGPVPDVTSVQAKIQLARSGRLAAVKDAVLKASDEAQLWYSDARTWQRQNAYVIEIGAAIGLSFDEMDLLFRDAATIQA